MSRLGRWQGHGSHREIIVITDEAYRAVESFTRAGFTHAAGQRRSDGMWEVPMSREVSVESLAEIRVEFFGELAEDPKFTEFRQEVIDLRNEVSKLTDSLAATDAKAAHLLTRFEHWIVNRKLSGRP